MPSDTTTASENEAGYTIDDLAQSFNIARRTIHYYVREGLLPAPVFQGSKTRYSELQFERLRAVRHLLQTERRSIAETRRALAHLDRDAIREVGAPPQPPETAPPPSDDDPRWKRTALLPGLELHVSSAASALVKRIAKEIVEKYAATPAAD